MVAIVACCESWGWTGLLLTCVSVAYDLHVVKAGAHGAATHLLTCVSACLFNRLFWEDEVGRAGQDRYLLV